MEDVPERALVVFAHPDDVDFGAAGTVARWADAGSEVTYCVVTDGDAGGSDPSISRDDMASIRHREQEAAAAEVGAKEVLWLGYPDGQVEVSLDLRRDIARVIRQVRPERVLAPSPERMWERIFASHPDHLAVGEATACAVYPDARNPFAFPELAAAGLEPHTVPEMWLMATPQPDVYVDVTEQLDRKLTALRCHVSQSVDRNGQLEQMVRGFLGENGRRAGWVDGRLAEAFRRIPTG